MLDNIIAQLSTVPLSLLYLIAAAVAAIENIFPPFPSDIIVAFTVFISGRVGGPFWLAAVAVTIGNVAGGMLMYYVGRRYGSLLLLEKLERYVGKTAGERLQAMHAKYGILALFVSRFLPGVRALVPPFAGAMKIPATHVFFALLCSSALWYTLIAYIAHETGENWDLVVTRVKQSITVIGLVSAVIVVASIGTWYVVRFLRKPPPSRPLDREQPPSTPVRQPDLHPDHSDRAHPPSPRATQPDSHSDDDAA